MRRLFAVPAWVWFLLAFAIRLGFALKLGGRFIQTDEIGYVEPARQLAETGLLGVHGRAAILPPIPIAFYAFFFTMGKSLLAPRLGLAVLGVLVCWLVSRMTRALTLSRGAGRLALALSAIYPFFIYYGGAVMSETPFLAALCCALWLTGAALSYGSHPKWAAGAGLSWAAAALCRPQALPTALAIWLVLAFLCYKARWRWSLLATAVLCWSLPLLAWAARNKALCGRFAVDAHGGVTFLHGTKYFDLNEIDTGVAMKAIRESDFYKAAEDLPEPERDAVYMKVAVDWLKENPGQAIRQFALKFGKFWRPYPRRDKVYAEHELSHPTAGFPRWALVAMSLAFEPALMILGFWGLWERRERWAPLLPAVLFLVLTCAVHTLVVSAMRYRLPVMPVLIMGAAAWGAKRLGEPRRRDR